MARRKKVKAQSDKELMEGGSQGIVIPTYSVTKRPNASQLNQIKNALIK